MTVKIALLGFGTVASGVPFLLKENGEKINQSAHSEIEVAKVLVKDEDEKNRLLAAGNDFNFVTNVDDILSDQDITIVVELMGRIEPAKTFITRALEAGKHVVTANKDLLAVHGAELLEIAKANKVALYYEAAVAGGIIGAIPGVLRAYLGTSEVIVTIMMNYIVLFVGNAFIRSFPKSVMQSVDSSKRVGANAIYQTEWLRSLTANSRMNIGIFFALIAVVLIWYMLKKTTLGFEIRAVGLNPNAAEYAGMSSKRTIILSMIISGALAGLGGVVEGLGTYQNVFVQGSSLSVGFNGMAVSLLAANSPIGILFAAFLFAVLSVGAPGMNVAQIPTELVNIVTASIIFFVSAHYLIERLTGKTVFELFKNRKQEAGEVKGGN